ncbi:MAG: helix-turn-helix transcriptional regulator [Hyphomicrobiaceae bacterium]|nr:helix-turn-helix transcriptional regulator [Hyphomicrobiaceae bacterium]
MTDRLDSEAVLDIIEHIYAAGVDPQGWPEVAELCQQLLPGCGFSLLLSNAVNEIDGVACGAGYDPKTIEEYVTHYHAMNPYLPIIDALPSDQVAHVRDYVSRDWLLSQPFYHEWLKPAGDFIHGVTMPIRSNGTGRLLRLTYDIPSARADAEGVAAEFLGRTKTHFRRAFEVAGRLHQGGEALRLGQALLDKIAGPAFIVDASAKIAGMNARALNLLRDGRVTRPASGDRLSFFSARAESLFQRLLQGATTITQVSAPSGFLVDIAGVQNPVIVLPLPSGAPGAPGAAGRRLALVQIGRREPVVPSSELLRSLYNLTRAEAGVVQRVAAGEAIKDIAEANDTSQSTVRNQLQSAMQKLGVHRQAELVGVLAGLTPRLSLDE